MFLLVLFGVICDGPISLERQRFGQYVERNVKGKHPSYKYSYRNSFFHFISISSYFCSIYYIFCKIFKCWWIINKKIHYIYLFGFAVCVALWSDTAWLNKLVSKLYSGISYDYLFNIKIVNSVPICILKSKKSENLNI